MFLLDAPKELAVVIGKEAWENQGGYAGNYFLKFPKNCFTIVTIRQIVAIVSICLEEEEKTMNGSQIPNLATLFQGFPSRPKYE